MSLAALSRNIARHQAKVLTTPKHAAVACITRLADRHDEHSLEVLFILRAEMPGNAWSGHVAFPGGKKDASDPTERYTAERETREEIGLDLTHGFELLGRLDDMKAKPDMALSCWVYHQVLDNTPPLKLNTDEVASVAWIPLSRAADEANHTWITWPDGQDILPYYTLRGLGIDRLSFRGVDLGTRNEDDKHYILWGLTMRMVCDLLRQAEYPHEHMRKLPYFHYEGKLGLLNNVVNVGTGHLLSTLFGIRMSWPNAIKVHIFLMYLALSVAAGTTLQSVAKVASKL
eukprot:TRINITY_DN22775_c0_g1_i1.p1 TRINITY_DN22775_c0_g1~~TRINITY_DN22775_c0_g1_i1.p1  ORF type:complete len:287 (+),score=91.88 TRINITY_DN22775_c0_g1_i1:415-1275(+)